MQAQIQCKCNDNSHYDGCDQLLRFYYELPYTAKEKLWLTYCNSKQKLNIEDSAIVFDQLEAPMIRYFKAAISSDLLETLQNSTDDLVAAVETHQKQTKRGTENCLHLGNWRKSSKLPFPTVDSSSLAAKNWITANQKLADHCSALFQKNFPILFAKYTKVAESDRVFGAWTTCAINVNFACEPHYDDHDYQGGLCWVIPFGSYKTGRSLFFPHLNIEVFTRPGDLICFRSFALRHQVRNYDHVRNSVVFFTHQNMFFPCFK